MQNYKFSTKNKKQINKISAFSIKNHNNPASLHQAIWYFPLHQFFASIAQSPFVHHYLLALQSRKSNSEMHQYNFVISNYVYIFANG